MFEYMLEDNKNLKTSFEECFDGDPTEDIAFIKELIQGTGHVSFRLGQGRKLMMGGSGCGCVQFLTLYFLLLYYLCFLFGYFTCQVL